MQNLDVAALLERIGTMEQLQKRQVRMVWALKCTLVVLLVGAATSLLAAAAAPTAQQGALEASKFVLRDKAGRYRGEFSAEASDRSSGLVICGPDGRPQARLVVEPDGTSAIELLGSKSQAKFAASVAPTGSVSLYCLDENKKTLFALMQDNVHGTTLSLSDKAQRSNLLVSTRTDGEPGIMLRDNQADRSIWLKLNPSSTPTIQLRGPEGSRSIGTAGFVR